MYMYYKVLIMSSVYTHKGLRDVLRGRALIIHDNSAYNVILLKMHTLYVDPASRGLELSSMCACPVLLSVLISNSAFREHVLLQYCSGECDM